MMIIERPEDYNQIKCHTAVALGAFDGIHLGHMALLREIKSAQGLVPTVFTFAQSKGKYITSNAQRKEIFASAGAEVCVFRHFDEAFKNLEPEVFVEKYLFENLRAKLVVVGFNYRFGKGGKGDGVLLQHLCKGFGIDVVIVPAVEYQGCPISSTRIRSCINTADFYNANTMLGRNFSIEGVVQQGDKIGSKIGFPTANILPHSARVMPPEGVYATIATINGQKYKSITNFGGKPTIRDGVHLIETHAIGFNGELYGEQIQVEFVKKLRDITAFSGVAELTAQLQTDLRIRIDMD